MSCWGIIAAAGAGHRMGAGQGKALLVLGGRPLLSWSVDAFQRCPEVDGLVLVVTEADLPRVQLLLQDVQGLGCRLCSGGATRADSVARGLSQLPESCQLVVIHDGARPLVSAALIGRVIHAARTHGAATAALPVGDTLKRGHGTQVAHTVDRRELYRAQTPQAFTTNLIRRAHAERPAGGPAPTDDAQLVEGLGRRVELVPGEPRNIKLTHPQDLPLAKQLLAGADGAAPTSLPPRVGWGTDVHRLVPGRPLVLGGVTVPHDRGLLGHSDADVLTHAVIDALLGAAALGDLGTHFPDDDPRWRGANSLALLHISLERLAEAGWRPANVDATLLCQRPRLAAHIPAMRANLARELGLPLDRVSVKATTLEGLGALGRGEGLSAQAVALIVPASPLRA